MMSEKDFAPLSPACVRMLNEKVYDKRKPAALEIEKMIKEFSARNNTVQIKRLLKVLGQDFAASHNANTRKGGLIGLGAISVGLGKDSGKYIDDLIHPILTCFSDPDVNVRYYACESLYNVVKIARCDVLPLFTDIFSGISKLSCDPEQQIKNATELLDRLMKDIVTDSGMFDLRAFMPILREQIYTKNPFGRQFLISWVSVLDAVPDMDFIIELPEILDGLYKILEDPTPEIKKITDTVLNEFLRSIRANPTRVDYSGMINILITHAQSNDELLQLTAVTWIKEFINLSGKKMLPYTSGILTAILPCFAYDGDNRKSIKDTATQVNQLLMKLITSKDYIVDNSDDKDDDNNKHNVVVVDDDDDDTILGEKLDLVSVVEVLTKNLMHTSVPTKVVVLKWIYCLFINIPDKMNNHIEDLFIVLMKILGDCADDVTQQTLVVFSEIIKTDNINLSSGNNKYFTKFIINLLRLFSKNKTLLEERGAFIIRELCVLLSAEKIYRIMAEILLEEKNLKFACVMIQALNVILLTSSELFELRNKLKDLNSKESQSLFVCLYESWCHNPVATVALCLLGQKYSHACDLVRSFASIEVTVEFLTEIDKLVQLIESPIFTYLRLELLEPEKNEYLVRTLYGLLMILPQSDAFLTLHKRLAAIPPTNSLRNNNKNSIIDHNFKQNNDIDFTMLLKHFEKVQDMHKEHKKRLKKLNLLVDRDSIANQFNDGN
ncbi:hypothetical protein HCN44_006644 [Aphidius gifuensis]|uniref:Protein VAC14 homolog n=1 Tax=Aphidius gifuensis TaxID=684658 RepID=A0A835CTN0_APHGI|nr:protein VAC14 homolog [Aphidius gifuensis]KAF7995537.1 hypothetical protein HCN44_006644 [Aphidius gifuensis]